MCSSDWPGGKKDDRLRKKRDDSQVHMPPRRSQSPDKGNATRRVHEGLRHEQHHEAEHEVVLAELVAWLRETLPTPVTPTAPSRVAAAVSPAAAV